jgi:mRNA interferase MazF
MALVTAAPVSRGEVHLVAIGPAVGGEMRKTRPCVVVSPDELNTHLRTLIVAPLTTGRHAYPFRVGCRFLGKRAHVVLDQVRTVDRERLIRRLGRLPEPVLGRCLQVLQAMFAP